MSKFPSYLSSFHRNMSLGPTAVVTGANAGIGLALCEQLLASHPGLRLCLACRNEQRAEVAKASLQAAFPDAVIDVVIVDTSSVKSVLQAATVLKEKYKHIDFLYLNAGVMLAAGVRWNRILSGIFSSQCVRVLTTGEGLIVQKNSKTPDGLMNVFATNLFGHYVLLRELEGCLGTGSDSPEGVDRPSQLIWTSSSNAIQRNFSLQDIQHEKGEEPYSSSKFATDMLSVALNEKYNKQGVYSHSTCPGLVMTNMTEGILPAWFWWLVLPFMLLMRILVPSMTNTPSNGATALAWLSHQQPEGLDPGVKFRSLCGVAGKPYVETEKLKVDRGDCLKLWHHLEDMRKDITQHIRQSA